MRIMVVGASGLTGRWVVAQALDRGVEVIAYVRGPHTLPKREGLTVLQGALTDPAALDGAIQGTDAVLCCLGTRSMRFAKEVSLMQESLPLITASMRRTQVERLVLLSAFGIGDTARMAGWVARFIYRIAFNAIYRDKELAEAGLARTPVKWTILYPVGLTNGPLNADVEVLPLPQVEKVPGLPRVSRANVARVMLDVVGNDQTIGQRILVTARSASLRRKSSLTTAPGG